MTELNFKVYEYEMFPVYGLGDGRKITLTEKEHKKYEKAVKAFNEIQQILSDKYDEAEVD